MAELSHEQLWHVRQREPGDYVPYGKRKRLTARQIWGDCSCVCKWFHTLSGSTSKVSSLYGMVAWDCREVGAVRLVTTAP